MAIDMKVGILTQAGGAHLSSYLAAFADCDDVASVAIADDSGSNFASAEKALGEKLSGTYKDAGEMLKKQQPKLVLVTKQANLAPAAIDQALEAGCHVIAEKPACVRAEDFAPLVKKAESKHLHLMLAFANRLNPPTIAAKQIMTEGKLGRLYGMQVHLMADQTRLTRPSYRQSWFSQKEFAGGGHLTWLGIHWLDLACYLSDLKVREVTGFIENVGRQPIDVEDSVALSLRFEQGVLGTMQTGYYLDRGYHSNVTIWGEDGWLRLTRTGNMPLEYYSRKEKDPQVRQVDVAQEPRGYGVFVDAIVKAIGEDRPVPVTGPEGLHVLRTIYAAYKAASTGQTQKVEA